VSPRRSVKFSLHGLLRLRFISFVKDALLLNFNKLVKREILIMIVQKLEVNLSLVGNNLCAWFNIFGLEIKDIKCGKPEIEIM
jgi:hypothetical protein